MFTAFGRSGNVEGTASSQLADMRASNRLVKQTYSVFVNTSQGRRKWHLSTSHISASHGFNDSFDALQLRITSLLRSDSFAPSTTSRSWLAYTRLTACIRVRRSARVELFLAQAILTSTWGPSECRARCIHIHPPPTRPIQTAHTTLFLRQEALPRRWRTGTRLGLYRARPRRTRIPRARALLRSETQRGRSPASPLWVCRPPHLFRALTRRDIPSTTRPFVP